MAGIRPVTMELGGKSALIVFDDADVEAAVSGAILGNFYSAGQICSNGTRVFLQRGIREAFLARLLARVAALKIGDPMDEETDIGPLVSAAHRNRVATYVARAEVEGAYQMAPPRKLPPGDAWHEPVVFTNVTDWMTLARKKCSVRSWPSWTSMTSKMSSQEPMQRTSDWQQAYSRETSFVPIGWRLSSKPEPCGSTLTT